MTNPISQSGESEAIVIIKAAPHVGDRHGETVCCAGIDIYGNWVRLFPISFRTLDEAQKFRRWDKISFRWRKPKDDLRTESRRVDQDSIKIVGSLKANERQKLLAPLIVDSLKSERAKGRSLALLKTEVRSFRFERKSKSEFESEAKKFAEFRKQGDLLNSREIIPYSPCPYRFKYAYVTADGAREGTCQDWEMEATYFRWSGQYGEERALELMVEKFGVEYPAKGILFAMGTHSLWPDQWLINGIVRLNVIEQPSLL